MNEHVHPLMRQAIAHMVFQRTQPDDLPRAMVEVNTPFMIGTLVVADLEGKVWVYRQDGRIEIDDIEIVGWRQGRQSTAGIGKDHGGRFRDLSLAQQQEHLCACAFHDLIDDPRFIERAEEALAEAEREWRIG